MQLYPLKLISDNTNINFIKIGNFAYIISVILIILSIVFAAIWKLNFGIDFAGGIAIEVKSNHDNPDLNKIREALNKLDIGEITIQNFGTAQDLSIRASGHQQDDLMKNVGLIKESLISNFPEYNLEFRKVDFVGPQVGSHMITAGIKAIILSFLAIMVYIWIRFEWQFGLGIVITLIHDAILCIGFMSVTQLDFNQASIAGILTVIGYSVNDSVVIYDRIRKNLKEYHKNTIAEIINISVNQTLSRTTLTVLTTLIANLALIIFAGEAIRSFSILVFVGIIIGTYSSIFISASLLIFFKLEKLRK